MKRQPWDYPGRVMHEGFCSRYDWVNPSCTRTPEEYPYSHSEYYIWRDFPERTADDGIHAAYTDRMSPWDHAKWVKAADGKMQNYASRPVSPKAADEIVKEYFGPQYKCVGFIQSMNVSSGYPLGVFLYRETEPKPSSSPSTPS